MIVSPANTATSNGLPQFGVDDVPPQSQPGWPTIKQPDVYFGVNDPGYVIADTKQAEIDYQQGTTGQSKESNYTGNGGVQLNSFLKRAAFAIRFGDLNVLISNLITPQSRMMFVRDIQTEVQKAAPFLSLDSDPYAVLTSDKGDIDWVQDAYTTTDNYPYSQNADTSAVSTNSGLSGQDVQLRTELRKGCHRRIHRADDLLRDGRERSDHRDLGEGLPLPVHPVPEDAPRSPSSPQVPRGHLSRSRQRCMASTTSIRHPPSTTQAMRGACRRTPERVLPPKLFRAPSPPMPRDRPSRSNARMSPFTRFCRFLVNPIRLSTFLRPMCRSRRTTVCRPLPALYLVTAIMVKATDI